MWQHQIPGNYTTWFGLNICLYIVNGTYMLWYKQCTLTSVIFVAIKMKLFGKLTQTWQTVLQK